MMSFPNDIQVVATIPYTSNGKVQQATVSQGNSTSTPLGSNGTWQGDWEDVTRFAMVSLLVYVDQQSSTDGLLIEWSTDGVNVDDTDEFDVPAGNGKFYTFPPEGRFVRVSYTNGSTAQSEFRLQTIYRYTIIKSSSHRLITAIDDDDDAELVRAVISAKDSNGQYKNLKLDAANQRLLTDSALNGEDNFVKIVDGAGSGRKVAVDASNRLVVSANATIIPAASTEVSRSAQSDLTTVSDDVYQITNGKTLTISRFAGGSEGNSGKRSKCELYYDPNGNGTGMTLLRTMYLGGTNYEFTLDLEFIGDGTRSIRMRRERLDGSADEVAAFWNGFET